MSLRFDRYAVFSCAVAATLATAGALKLHEFISGPADPTLWRMLAIGAFEVTFSWWLAIGLLPRYTRLIAIAVFFVFLNVALGRLLEQQPTCGCFGKLPVSPWLALLFDAAVLVGFVTLRPGASDALGSTRQTHRRWLFAGGACFVILALATFGVVRGVSGRHDDRGEPLSASQQLLLAEMRDSIRANYAVPEAFSFEAERVLRNLNVQKEERVVERSADGKTTSIAIRSPAFRDTFRYVIRGGDLRRDTIAGDSKGRIETVFRGRHLQFDESTRHAWIGNRSTTAHYVDSFNPRCWGFLPALMDFDDWFEMVRISEVKDIEGEVASRRVTARSPRGTTLYVTFAPNKSFLPTRVDEYFASGALATRP